LLPFDLRRNRAVTYFSAADAPKRAAERRMLEGQLEDAMREVLKRGPVRPPSLELALDYKVLQRHPDIHHTNLGATFKNTGPNAY